jgi:hypothetical protein
MINVFLDDRRPCPKGFRLARNAEQCIRLLKTKSIDVLSLDHDLGFGQPTGYDVVKYMVKHGLYAKNIVIHSANPFGRARMLELLNRNKPDNVPVFVRPAPLF